MRGFSGLRGSPHGRAKKMNEHIHHDQCHIELRLVVPRCAEEKVRPRAEVEAANSVRRRVRDLQALQKLRMIVLKDPPMQVL